MIDQASVPSLMGSTVRDNAGQKIGKVGQVYLDDTTGQPEWVTVRTGLFGTKESFVPLAAARVEGDELVVDIPKDRVSDAPRVDEDGHLTEEQETELYTYYGVSQGAFGRQTAGTDAATDAATESAAGSATDGDYLRTDRQTGVAPTGVPTDYDRTDRRTGVAGNPDAAAVTPAADLDPVATPAVDVDPVRTDHSARTGTAAGDATDVPLGAAADPTGTPAGDVDVAEAMGGSGFNEAEEPGAGPDFARGTDGSVTGVGQTAGPDFARGEDGSVTGAPAADRPDFARGQDAESAGPVSESELGESRRRLRRWQE